MAFQEVIDAKQRIIQEFVPGKQVTIAHVIANPKPDLFRKMGLEEKGRNAIGILTITPGEGTIIAADIASKSGDIEIGFIDRFSGALLITGDVSAVESALRSVIAPRLSSTSPSSEKLLSIRATASRAELMCWAICSWVMRIVSEPVRSASARRNSASR